MYTLLLAVGVGLFIALVPLPFGVSAGYTVIPGILLGIFAFVWMNRRIAKRVEAVTQAADAEMAKMQRAAQQGPKGQAAMLRCIDQSAAILQKGFALEKWQVGIGTMLNARIGMLLYTKWLLAQQMGGRKVEGASLSAAIPYLEKSRIKGQKARLLAALWPAWAMLAVAYYKAKKDLDAALAVLEDTERIAKKHGIVWSLHAWLLAKEKRTDEAIDVLARARDAAPDDGHIPENLALLQNGKKMKMRGYGESWYQFGLERPKMAGAQMRMGHPRMRGGRRR